MVPQTTFVSEIRPVKVVAGGNFTVILLRNGEMYIAGDCMLEPDRQTETWSKIPGTFSDVACGWSHIVAITGDSKVVTAGVGAKGELGQGKRVESPKLETVMEVQDQNAQVFACFYNSYVLDGENLYGWGSNTKCQLQDSKSKSEKLPVLVQAGDISRVCAGKNSICFVAGGQIYARGAMAKYLSQMRSELQVSDELQLKSMWTSVTSLDKGQFRFFGPAAHKQDAIVGWPAGSVTTWSTGSEHAVLCREQHVFCWGWGEHGNCGAPNGSSVALAATNPVQDLGANDQSNICSPVNPVYVCAPYENVYSCFAGCATTWVCLEKKTRT